MKKTEMTQNIFIKGACEHNLKNIDIHIPRNKLVVITGLSGSGKSSLAFDTLYAEGQRRYVESLSAYARQFLEQMEKPNVEYIEGLSPAIAIQQKAPGRNPRSTVGTVTEIYDYLRLLFAKIGKPHCPKCSREIRQQSSQQIIDEIIKLPRATKIQVLAPLVRARKGEYRELFNRIRQEGFVRVRVDGEIYGLDEEIRLDKKKRHNIEVVVDRLVVNTSTRDRLADSVETALKLANGLVLIAEVQGKKGEHLYSEHHACPNCGISIGEIAPRNFSFNSPYGACPECTGLGVKDEPDPSLVIPDENLSISEGAILPWTEPVTTRRHRWKSAAKGYYYQLLRDASEVYGIDMNKPFGKLLEKHQDILLYGSPEAIYETEEHFEGVIEQLQRRYRETESEYVREEIFNKYFRTRICPLCKGARLKKESLAVTINGKAIYNISKLSIEEAREFFSRLSLTDKEKIISHQILKEIRSRLDFLMNVGLDYITLERSSSTLAGGEAQRIHLATQIGSSLVGVMYVLDEPTIGLHQRDNRRLLSTLKRLRDGGNTVIVVEHDKDTIQSADFLIDLGPGAGVHGGRVVVSGSLDDVKRSSHSLTGRYLSGELKIPLPEKRKKGDGNRELKVIRASQFNLKDIDVTIPLGLFNCVTGVSGSGKSTLVEEVIYKTLAEKLYHSREKPGKHKGIKGLEFIDKVIIVDQSPIGRTPRSNPVTYTGAFTPIRQLFSQLPTARMKGYKPGRFSFNVKGGRCETCQGDGEIKIEMQFLPDVYVKCEVCKGARFNKETLDVKFKGKNIADVLGMSVEEALDFFRNIPKIKRILQTLYDVGLGYIKLGQPAPTLSGGEAQRVKLACELSKRSTGRTFYILDEPTTGLHFADIEKLLDVLHRLVDKGNTVLVIEHNMEVIKTADNIIDLGPEGGDQGGEVVATGTPEVICRNKRSYTGKYLKEYIKKK